MTLLAMIAAGKPLDKRMEDAARQFSEEHDDYL
jgi:hypothetical protein